MPTELKRCTHKLKHLCKCPAEAKMFTPVPEAPPLPDPLDELEDPAVLANYQRQLVADDLRGNLSKYIRAMWHVIEPTTELTWNWHHELICNVLQGMFEDWERSQDDSTFLPRVVNAIFNVPPGSLKSRIISVGFPTWVWLRRPSVRFICLSVNIDAAQRDARDSRTVIRSDWYKQTFEPDWVINDDQDAITNYGNTARGIRLSRAQGSEIVGLRGDIILNDDPNNPREAESKTVRDEVNELWDTNIYNRVNDVRRSLRIGVQQRTHALDWTGYVTKKQGLWHPTENPHGWLVIALPAEFESDRRCLTPWGKDIRKKAGQTIDKTRMPEDWLKLEKFRFGSAKYAGQMQQRPALAEGGRVKKVWWKWFKLVDEGRHGRLASASYPLPYPKIRTNGNGRPRGCDTLEGARIVKPDSLVSRWDFDWIYITIDPAIKKTVRGSNFGILVAGGQGARRFILEDATQKGDIVEILALLEQLVKRWKPDRVLIEDKASGPDIIKMFQEKLGNGDIKDELGQTITTVIEPVNPGVADKEMRLDACIPQIEGGMVYLLEGCDWEEFVDEFAMFPNGLNDDRCDALSQLLNHVKTAETILPDW